MLFLRSVIDVIRSELLVEEFVLFLGILAGLIALVSVVAFYSFLRYRPQPQRPDRLVVYPVVTFLLAMLILGATMGFLVVLSGDLEEPEQRGTIERTAPGLDCPEGPDDDRFTFAIVPDVQGYTDDYPNIFDRQTAWIAATDCYNVEYVIQLGDLVEHHNEHEEFERADRALSTLERHDVPYGVLAGDHDNDGGTDYSNYDRYFGYERFADEPHYGGSSDEETNRHHYDLVSAEGVEFVVVYLSYEDEAEDMPIEWASDVLDRHDDRTAIIVTHCNLDVDGRYGCDHEDTGLVIHHELVKQHENVALVLSSDNHGVARKQNEYGNHTSYEVLQNYQEMEHHGNGWLRMYTFYPKDDRVKVDTYSPYLDEHAVDEANDFALEYERLERGESTQNRERDE